MYIDNLFYRFVRSWQKVCLDDIRKNKNINYILQSINQSIKYNFKTKAMRKSFTWVFNLTLVFIACCSANLAHGAVADFSASDVDLKTDLGTVCDGDDVQYQVNQTAFPSGTYEYQFNNGDGYTLSSLFTTPEGSTFTVRVRLVESGDESDLVTINAAVVTPVTYTVDAQDASCNGSNGKITINADGGGGDNYSYYMVKADNLSAALADPSAFMVASNQIGRPIGEYYAAANNSAGCVDLSVAENWKPAMIEEPEVLTISVASTSNPVCVAGNGSVTYTLAGGTADYTVILYNESDDAVVDTKTVSGTTVTFEAPQGSYYAEVSDNFDCSAGVDQITLTDPEEIALTSNITETNYWVGGENAAFEVTATSGDVSALTYTLQKESTDVEGYVDVAEATFEGLAAGEYSVVAKSSLGCDDITVGAVTIEDGTYDFTLTGSDITCNGANDGSMTIQLAGDAVGGAFQFQTGLQSWQTMASDSKKIVVTAAGTYTVKLKDSEGHVSPAKEVKIEEPEAVEVTLTSAIMDGACPSDEVEDGQITVSVTGGNTVDYDLVLKTSEGTSSATGSAIGGAYVFENVAAGNYTVVATETGGTCSGEVEVVVEELEPIVATAVVTQNVLCKGASTGVISVTGVAGGTAGYTVSLNGESGSAAVEGAVEFTELPAGEYEVSVTDGNTCTAVIASLTIEEPEVELTATLGEVEPIGCTTHGSFEIMAEGGNGSYLYYASMISDEPTEESAWSEESTVDAAVAGMYYVWVVDAAGEGCVINAGSQAVTTVNDLVFTAEVNAGSPILCYGEADGAIDVSEISGGQTGGVGPFTYSVTGTAYDGTEIDKTYDQAELTGLPASNDEGYTVTVTEVDGCSASEKVVITQATEIVASLYKQEGSFTCFDAVEGYIEATAEGGTGSFEYQLWRSDNEETPYVNWQEANSFLVPVGYSYQIAVRDENSCEVSTNIVEISEVQPVTFSVEDVTCHGTETASAVVTASGQEGRTFSVRYRLTGSTEFSEWMEFNGTTTLDLPFAETETTSYEFEVKDSEGCTSPDGVVSQSFVAPAAELVAAVTLDGNDISVEVTGGTEPYSYMLDGATVEMDAFVGLADETYVVKVMDAHGCTTEETSVTIDTTDPTATYSPNGVTIEDNQPEALVITFDEKVVLSEAGGNLMITAVGGTEASVTVPLAAEMVSEDGMSVEVTYDAAVSGGLDKATEYSVTVDAGAFEDMSGNTWDGVADETEWTFTTGADFATGVVDPVDESPVFTVYPNPFNENVKVENADKLSRIIISNVAGQRVKDIVSPTEMIQTSDLRSGIYFITLITKDDVVAKTERIVKK